MQLKYHDSPKSVNVSHSKGVSIKLKSLEGQLICVAWYNRLTSALSYIGLEPRFAFMKMVHSAFPGSIFQVFFYLYLIVLSRKKAIQWQSQTLFLKTILSFLKSSDDFSSLVPAQVISSGWKFPGPRSAQKAETFLLWPTERRRVLLRSLQTKCRDRSVIERSVADSTQQKRQLTFWRYPIGFPSR